LEDSCDYLVPHRESFSGWKISEDTLEKLQKFENSNSEDANSDDEITDPGSADDDNQNSAEMSPSTPPEPSTEFLIDPDIDINSEALLDMISEQEVVSDKPINWTPDLQH